MINCGTFSKEVEMFVEGTPSGVLEAEGAQVTLSDGKQYIDTVLGLGAYPRGYDRRIAQGVRELLANVNGLTFTLPHALWESVKLKVQATLNLDDVRPVRTGSDGCLAAVTLARAVRPGKVVVCKDNYHGQWLQWKDPARGSVIDRTQFIEVDERQSSDWPDPEDISCVIYEYPLSPPATEWISYIRLMRSEGVIFIADEVVTALRWPGNRALPYADLVVAGKGLANGFGLYVLGGRAELMSEFDLGDPVFVSSTYAADVAALVGAARNLDCPDARQLGDKLWRLGMSLLSGLDPEFFNPHAPLRIRGQPSRFIFEGDEELRAGFNKYCLEHGLLVNRPFFTCTKHVEHLKYMTDTLNAARRAGLRASPPAKLFDRR